MQKIRWFFLIVGIVLALAMALQNNEPADIRLLWLDAQFPLSVLLIVATAVGFLFGALLTASMLRSRKAAAKAKAAAKPESKPKLEPSPSNPSTDSPL
ncbi:hypothetical protein K227x_47760 [Rubripirellula lacrimiformis]|uniref:Lipopolysaccharide assembly protein A domain-containing protein n=1 Tax=Rubripirellula lacrimiformis TaxID=1930273 RepID=A0A517NGV8_9BACT|nr:LapA family protein [Rubripirellula lacrimiformis]QDT06367.1 hypothetical protein K227x_47760 [Rubripirellula lacrimiformis]